MSPELPAALVRGLSLAVPTLAAVGVCLWRPPRDREIAAMIVAGVWVLATLVPLNLYAVHAGWWSFRAEGAVWQGLPVDLLLAWAVLWGALPALLLRYLGPVLLAAVLVWLDVLVMPLLEPVVLLSARWLVGETAAVAVCLVPALLLADWTRRGRYTGARVWAQAVLAFGVLVGLPLAVLEAVPTRDAVVMGAQLVLIGGLPGLAAAREFARVGGGTPLPYDPPCRLVTSGPYSYVRNPMQVSSVLVLLVLAVLLGNPAPLLGVVIAIGYSVGFASWHEGGQLSTAFGADWENYRAGVRPWLPRLRPWPGRARGTLYVAADCCLCRGLAVWITVRRPVALDLRPAAEHPDVLYRLTYEDTGGNRWSGVAALARAWEHLNLGWALAGWALGLPGVRHGAQWCGDAFGAGPRPSRETPSTPKEITR